MTAAPSLPVRDYGPRARVGVATPQANPTVEPEMRALIPASIGVYGTRLTHAAPRVEERLAHYVRHMPQAIASFGSMRLEAFGFGCTGSSYLAGRALEDELTREAARASGVPVVTAAQAIREALEQLGARRIALVSPYPAGLAEVGYGYWEQAGIEVVAKLRVDPQLQDTHLIYELTGADALQALQQIDASAADCIVASGTGMPTLAALRSLGARIGARPVLSSNLCLAWALTRRAAPELAPAQPGDLLAAAQAGGADHATIPAHAT